MAVHIRDIPTVMKKNSLAKAAEIPLSELQFLYWLTRLVYPKTKRINSTDRIRLNGLLDVSMLNKALADICKNNPILSYHIAHYAPVQREQNLPAPHVKHIDISHLTPAQQERQLQLSIYRLQHVSWQKGKHLLQLNFFVLSGNNSELQIAVSPFISDPQSLTLLFSILSEYYLTYKNNEKIRFKRDRFQFKDFIGRGILHPKILKQKMAFWESYLQDTSFPDFPKPLITSIKKQCNTVYINIAEEHVERLQIFCHTHAIRITDSLCAAMGMGLTDYLTEPKKLVVTLINSSREDNIQQQELGLFVRSDLVKIDLTNSPGLLALSQRVHQSVAETAPYQACPQIIKLGYLVKRFWKAKKIGDAFIGFCTWIYARCMGKYKLDHRVLRMLIRVFLTRKNHYFIVNINIPNNFMVKTRPSKLFNLELNQIKPYQPDKIIDKNTLNLWWVRNRNHELNLVLSGNLEAAFLQKLGKNIIGHITLPVKD